MGWVGTKRVLIASLEQGKGKQGEITLTSTKSVDDSGEMVAADELPEENNDALDARRFVSKDP